jgi:hypothetical protein
MIGWRHVDLDGISTVIAGSASVGLSLERDYSPTDFAFFEKREDKYFLNGTKEIRVEKTGTINEKEYIIYKVTSLSPAIDQDLPAKAAMVTVLEDTTFDYRTVTFNFANPGTTEEIMTVLSSLKFE